MDKELSCVLRNLAKRRPVFHSEDDFKFELAWELKTRVGFQVQIEFPFHLNKEKDTKGNPRNLRLDLRLSDGKKRYGIELKYKTKALDFDNGDLKFKLRDQGGDDQARYDFMKDIWRIEESIREGYIDFGYSIFLTNAANYWKAGRENTIDQDFKLYDGRKVSGNLKWAKRASSGTTKSRTRPIRLNNKYQFNWDDYSSVCCAVEKSKYTDFKYLAVSSNRKR